jgi:hypothetical protein
VTGILLAATLSAFAGCPVERIASIRLVDGTPFVQPLRHDVRVVRRADRSAQGGAVYVIEAGAGTYAQIAFEQQAVAVSGVVGSEDPHRVDVYAWRGRCPHDGRSVKTFDPQTGLLVP